MASRRFGIWTSAFETSLVIGGSLVVHWWFIIFSVSAKMPTDIGRGQPVTAGERIGKFHVLGQLGQGAHSSILHIRRKADSKQYALKVVPISGPDELNFLEQAEHEVAVSQ